MRKKNKVLQMAKRKKKWIQKLKEGSYTAQLKRLGVIKGDEKIPVEFSRKVCDAEIGSTIKWNGKSIKVTELLKKRACAHLTLRKLARKRKKR